ncbi:MAG: flagellin lysine-N-methylase [Terracidiphilus sp.]|nr:flagellin lysine-N-methylase [Terracidiphilus sp.]
MLTTRLIRPDYSTAFRCIGPACEDTCCAGWRVDLDRASFERLHTIPEGPLKTLVEASVVRGSTPNAPLSPSAFAQIRMTASGRCPIQSEDGLCRIHAEHGAGYLPELCATYPRIPHSVEHRIERALSLACPEAARLVLLNPDLMAEPIRGAQVHSWDEKAPCTTPVRTWFWPVREFAIDLIRNRAYPLWQRMFLLGTFSRRMDAIIQGTLDRSMAALLADFSAAVGKGSLRAQMETIPSDLALQLEMVMELVRLRVDAVKVPPRLRASLQAFIQGIGAKTEPGIAAQSAHYAAAHDRYYAPFFLRRPHILENYLVNAILSGLYPFGLKLYEPDGKQEPGREFAMLAAQFALIKGLLIGVAGCHREAFSSEHVVETIQVVCKYFEHDPQQLDEIEQLLRSRDLDNARGIAMLLRN